MSRECIICGDKEEEGRALRYTCQTHSMCLECLQQSFQHALDEERFYPPSCCSHPAAVMLISNFEDDLPLEFIFKYQIKERGEYAINPKSRVYCATPACGAFLNPATFITVDAETSEIKEAQDEEKPEEKNSEATGSNLNHAEITFAVCIDCKAMTCASCKQRITAGLQSHQCEVSEEDKQFAIVARENRYQNCYNCGLTIELAEACNHISCECGADFCYVCGKPWEGIHGCPHYGPAQYDDEGYNQEGFHRDTDLNREGRTRREQAIHDHGEDPDDFHDDDEEEGGEEGEEGEDEEEEGFGLPPELQEAVDNGTISWEDAILGLQMAHHEDDVALNLPIHLAPLQGQQGELRFEEEEEDDEEDGNEDSGNEDHGDSEIDLEHGFNEENLNDIEADRPVEDSDDEEVFLGHYNGSVTNQDPITTADRPVEDSDDEEVFTGHYNGFVAHRDPITTNEGYDGSTEENFREANGHDVDEGDVDDDFNDQSAVPEEEYEDAYDADSSDSETDTETEFETESKTNSETDEDEPIFEPSISDFLPTFPAPVRTFDDPMDGVEYSDPSVSENSPNQENFDDDDMEL